MSETQTPVDEGFMRVFKEMQRKVDDISNGTVGGQQFTTGDLIPSFSPTRAGAVLCDGTIYLDTDPAIGAALAAMLRAAGFSTDATHVQVPDYQGRVIGGVGGSLGSLGVPVGASTVTLTATQSGLPGHSHTMPAATGGPSVASTGAGTAHSHGSPGNPFVTATGGGGQGFGAGSLTTSTTATTATEAAHTHSLQSHTHTLPDTDTVTAAAAASAHTNLQPTLPSYIHIKC